MKQFLVRHKWFYGAVLLEVILLFLFGLFTKNPFYEETLSFQDNMVRINTLEKGVYEIDVTYQSELEDWLSVEIGQENTYVKLIPSVSHMTKRYELKKPSSITLYSSDETSLEQLHITRLQGTLWIRLFLFLLGLIGIDYYVAEVLLSKHKEKIVLWTGLLFTILVSSIPLLLGKPYYGHDIHTHLLRIQNLALHLQHGIIPTRMNTLAYAGYGCIVPIFYNDLFLIPSALLYLCGLPLYQCNEVYIFGMNILCAWISYLCFFKLLNDQKSALISSFVYTCSFYRIMDIYTRQAMGEYSAFSFLPIAFIGLIMILFPEEYDKKNWGSIVLALGVTLVFYAHTISTELLCIFLALFSLFFFKRLLRLQTLKSLGISIILFLGWSAWYWVGMLDYQSGLEMNTYGVQSIQDSGLFLHQIFLPFPVVNGFQVNVINGLEDEMPLQIGIVFLFLIGLFCYRKFVAEDNHISHKIRNLCFGLGVFALLLTTIYFPWDFLTELLPFGSLLTVIQFPWRYLTIAICLFSFVCGFLLKEMKNQIYVVVACIFLTLVPLGSYYISMDRTMQLFPEASLSQEQSTWVNEPHFLPAEADTERFLTQPLTFEEGVECEILQDQPSLYQLHIVNSTNEEKKVLLPRNDYPNYHLYQGDQEIAITKSKYAQMELTVPAKEDAIYTLRFIEPMTWRIAEVVSLLSLLGFLFFLYQKRKSLTLNK